MNVLSIQSSVAHGHVGNSAASFALQRLGVTAWPVHTVQVSNHTGYADWRGRAFALEEVAEVIAGIEDRGVFPECDAVLSGYVTDAATARAAAGARELRLVEAQSEIAAPTRRLPARRI